MGKTFKKPEVLSDAHTHYCPGCTHGVIHRLVAEENFIDFLTLIAYQELS